MGTMPPDRPVEAKNSSKSPNFIPINSYPSRRIGTMCISDVEDSNSPIFKKAIPTMDYTG